MQFNIDTAQDISKLIAAIRLLVKGEFKVTPEVLNELMTRVAKFAKENNMTIEIVTPSNERIILCTASGVFLGAAAGFTFAGIPGAVAGAVVGGSMGYYFAHTKLVLNRNDHTDDTIIRIA